MIFRIDPQIIVYYLNVRFQIIFCLIVDDIMMNNLDWQLILAHVIFISTNKKFNHSSLSKLDISELLSKSCLNFSLVVGNNIFVVIYGSLFIVWTFLAIMNLILMPCLSFFCNAIKRVPTSCMLNFQKCRLAMSVSSSVFVSCIFYGVF